MNWDANDFAFAALLLGGTGAAFVLAARKAGSIAYRAAAGVALAAACMLVWVNAAVGLIGAPEDDANLMFIGVLAVAIAGAVIARLRAHGMVRAMLATAAAQVLVAVVALVAGWGSTGPAWPRDILIVTGFFTALWLMSAWLFRRAARRMSPAHPAEP